MLNIETQRPHKVKRRRIKPKLTKLIRRLHLYLGLTLVPWIILYGMTALLFNHSDWFSPRQTWSLNETVFRDFPAADQLAQQALVELGNEEVVLVPESASWLGHLSFRGANETHKARVYLHPEGSGGKLRLDPKSLEQPDWGDGLKDWAPISPEQQQGFEQQARKAVHDQDVELASLALRSYPTLRFQVLYNGEPHSVELELDGSMDIEKGKGGSSLRSKLMRLHVTHGSPGYIGARWFWARIVDVMGFAMILWGVTGMIMWWTLRTTRIQGAIALAVGGITIAVLATSIWMVLGML